MAIVARYRDLADAEVASASLEAAGIRNVLADTFMIGVLWSRSTALGGIRLHVSDADADEARELLETPAVAEWPAEFQQGSADEKCPVCGAFALECESGPRKTLAVMTGLGVPIWFWRSKMVCRSCGASQKVPLRFRPELLMIWLVAAVAVNLFMALLTLCLGYAIYGRRA
jgi:hypothetical protein